MTIDGMTFSHSNAETALIVEPADLGDGGVWLWVAKEGETAVRRNPSRSCYSTRNDCAS